MEEVWSSQIVIPPSLPSILKKYAKAAIRTQPYDLLVWSAAYFRAMAAGCPPPIKPRLELTRPEGKLLTLGYIKLLVSQFGREGEVRRDELVEKWGDVSLPIQTLDSVLSLGNFSETVDWPKFVAISLGFLEQSLKGTMLRVCEVLTEEPEGGSAAIPCKLFLSLYRCLGEMECGEVESPQDEAPQQTQPGTISPSEGGETEIEGLEENQVDQSKQANVDEGPEAGAPTSTPKPLDSGLPGEEEADQERTVVPGIGPRLSSELMDRVEEYMSSCAERQGGLVMPRNLRHFLCPPLDIESSQPQA